MPEPVSYANLERVGIFLEGHNYILKLFPFNPNDVSLDIFHVHQFFRESTNVIV